MSRDEEIKQAEIKYSDDTLFDGCDYVGQYAKQEAFIAGAKWADDNPKSEMVNKHEFIEKLEKWIRSNTDWNEEYIWDGRNPNYGLWDELNKFMEE